MEIERGNAEIGNDSPTATVLANAAMFAGETVHWDKAKMDIVGKAGRDTQSYAREYRKGYKLPIYK